MKKNMHENSLEAFRSLKTGERCAIILREFAGSTVPLTDREIADRLGFKDMNNCRPRITELVAGGYLQEVGKVKDGQTGRSVRVCCTTSKVLVSA